MTRLSIPTRDDAPAASQPSLDAVGQQLGVIPNLFRLVAHSPAALEGWLALSGALNRTLDVKTRERIALAVAEVNGCDYCLAAHSTIGLNMARLSEAEVALARAGRSADPRADIAVAFAAKVARERGKVADADVAQLREAGFSEAQVIEIVVNVALNVLTNLVNNVAETAVDFPAPVARAA